jgi:hypothetical protein
MKMNPTSSSLWSLLPTELHQLIFTHTDLLTRYLNNLVPDASHHDAHQIWITAFETDWEGDLSCLPASGFPNVFTGLLKVRTRRMYRGLCRLKPEYMEQIRNAHQAHDGDADTEELLGVVVAGLGVVKEEPFRSLDEQVGGFVCEIGGGGDAFKDHVKSCREPVLYRLLNVAMYRGWMDVVFGFDEGPDEDGTSSASTARESGSLSSLSLSRSQIPDLKHLNDTWSHHPVRIASLVQHSIHFVYPKLLNYIIKNNLISPTILSRKYHASTTICLRNLVILDHNIHDIDTYDLERIECLHPRESDMLELLEVLRTEFQLKLTVVENGGVYGRDMIQWTHNLMNSLAALGHLEATQWVVKQIEQNSIGSLNRRSSFASGVSGAANRNSGGGGSLFQNGDMVVAAARFGRLDMVQYAHSINGRLRARRALHFAASYGQIEVCRFLSQFPKYWVQRSTMVNATAHGYLEAVEWLRGRYPKLRGTFGGVVRAVQAGHLEVVRWWLDHAGLICRKESNADIEDDYDNEEIDGDERNNNDNGGGDGVIGEDGGAKSLVGDVYAGDGFTDDESRQLFVMAAEGGHVDILRLIFQSIFESDATRAPFNTALAVAFECNRVRVFQWLWAQNVEACTMWFNITKQINTHCVLNYIEILQLLPRLYGTKPLFTSNITNDSPTARIYFDGQNLHDLCSHGYIDILQFVESAFDDGFPTLFDGEDSAQNYLTAAATNGHVVILDYIYQLYCSINSQRGEGTESRTSLAAYLTDDVFESICCNGHVNVLRYLYAHDQIGSTTFTTTTISSSSTNSSSTNNNFYMPEFKVVQEAQKLAIRNGHFHVLRFLVQKMGAKVLPSGVNAARRGRHLQMAAWLQSHVFV